MKELTIRELTFIEHFADKLFASEIADKLNRPLSFVLNVAKSRKIRLCNKNANLKILRVKGKSYLQIKPTRGKAKSLAREVYKWKYNAPVPVGHNIHYVDGNTLNCSPMNIEACPTYTNIQSYTFKKGSTPHNKNTKGLMKANRTSFKAGALPHNTKHDGAISIRQKQGEKPYKYLRIAKAKWVLLHRHTWEQANGPIPAGYLVAFKDGDTMNCELDNLELISKADNVKRNLNREKASESLRMRWKIKRAKAILKEEFPNIFD